MSKQVISRAALCRSVNAVEKDLILSREVIRDEQEKDKLCVQYKQYENFWADEDGILYRQGRKEQPPVVIPEHWFIQF